MSDGEVMTILITLHLKSYRNLKHFYINHVCKYMRHEFPDCISYNCFIELQKKVAQPHGVFMKKNCLGNCTGILFIDSTTLKYCHYKIEKQHKVFASLAQKSYGTLGWFYGFKLHLVCNDKGKIVEFMLTPGNVDDRKPLRNKSFNDKIFDKIYADKGYLGKDFFDKLFVDRVLLRKRAVIESVNDVLINVCYIEHTRHRSVDNFVANLVYGLIA